MPFIRVSTNTGLTEAMEDRLRSGMADIVREILHKDPVRMMTLFEGDMDLCRGSGENRQVPTAFVECKFFGGPEYAVFQCFDREMQKIYKENLNIDPENLYIKYEVINGYDQPARIFKI